MYVFVIVGVMFAVALLLLIAAVTYGRLLIGRQGKALAALRRNGPAFMCRPTMGMQHLAGFILSIDRNDVSLWKVGLRRPVRKQSFPSAGAGVAPATVKINVARSSNGLSVISATGGRLDVAIYPDPGMARAYPVTGPFLDPVVEQIRGALADTPHRPLPRYP